MKAFALMISLFGLITLSYAQDDEADIQELEKQRTEQQAEINQVQESVEQIQEAPEQVKENLKKQAEQLGDKALTLDDLMTEKYQKMIEETLKNNPLKDLSRDQLKQMLRAKVAGHPIEKLYDILPVTLEITVDMLKDDRAALGLLKLAQRRDALMNFTAIWLVIVISVWMLKKRIAPKSAPFVRRLIFKTALTILGSVVSFTLFYTMFREEIGPTVSIIVKNLL